MTRETRGADARVCRAETRLGALKSVGTSARATSSVFFDLDGTLVDSLPGIEYAVDSALAEWRLARTEPLRERIGPPIRSILQSVVGEATEEQLDRVERAFRTAYDSTGWRRTAPQAGAAEMLERLHAAGFLLFVVTNKPLDATEKILGLLGLRRYFREVLARNSVTPSFASKGQMIRVLLDRHALAPRDSLMVGDTGEDARAAAEAGIRAVIMAHGYGTGSELSGVSCRVLNNFSELTSLCALVGQALPPAHDRGQAETPAPPCAEIG
jgi:phosphoglycolate phosphatase